jgi:predicted amidophosphoribosyltransferase
MPAFNNMVCIDCGDELVHPPKIICPKCKNKTDQVKMASSTRIGTKMNLPSDVVKVPDIHRRGYLKKNVK